MRRESATQENSAFGVVCAASWRLTKVEPMEHYCLAVTFVDGTKGIVDLANLITSPVAGVFASLGDPLVFKQVFIQHGVATWPGDIDLAPDAMYDEIRLHGRWVVKARS